jgi:hypothetical protein
MKTFSRPPCCFAAYKNIVRLQVLTAVSMEVNVFWVVAQYNLVETDRRFRGVYGLRHQGDL